MTVLKVVVTVAKLIRAKLFRANSGRATLFRTNFSRAKLGRLALLFSGLLVIAGCSTPIFEENPFDSAVPQTVDTNETPPTEEEAVIPEPEKDNAPKVGEIAKDAHGIVNVHRHGPGYDILLSLDAGDSDMIFTMDLPENQDDMGMYDTFNRPLEESLTDQVDLEEVPVEEQDASIEAALEGQPDTRAKMMQVFYNSTKHILNAQKLFYRKDYWQALEQTNKAMELTPNSAQAHALKGSIYYKMGLKREARQSWSRALEIDPSMNDVRLTLQRLQ